MKLNKTIAISSGFISITSLLLSLYTNFCIDNQYATNVLIGLFSSGILICVTSIITYRIERNKTIYQLYTGCYTFMKYFEKNIRHDNHIKLYELKDNFDTIISSYKTDIYYYVCALAILPKRTKLYELVMGIWENTRRIYLFVLDDCSVIQSFLLGDITEEKLKSTSWKHNSSESDAHMKELKKSLESLAYHMNYYNKRKNSELEEPNNAD